MEKRIKIVWICGFSNKEIREKLHFEKYSLFQLARKLLRKKQNVVDYGEWNTKAIKEYIGDQLKRDHESDQLSMYDPKDPFTGSK